jgi:DNA end-binding protein Ku
MAPPSRAYWKGYLRLALVQIAVQIHSATEAGRSSMNLIHKPLGKRINYEVTVQGEPVNKEDVVKAYPVAENAYVTLEPEELNAVRLETKKTLDLKEFVKVQDVAPRYFEKPYYVTPEDEFSIDGYLVIRAGLLKQGRLGIGQITMGGREYLVAVGPLDKGLAMYVLRYADELRDPNKYFGDVADKQSNPEMVELALELIKQNTSPFKADRYQNSYEVALMDLVKKKSKGKKVIVREPDEARQSTGKVVDLMEALRKSVTGKSPKQRQPKKAVGKGRVDPCDERCDLHLTKKTRAFWRGHSLSSRVIRPVSYQRCDAYQVSMSFRT